MSERQGIEIDYCPKCRGVWLDRGELDKIIERSAAEEVQYAQRQSGRGRTQVSSRNTSNDCREDHRRDYRTMIVMADTMVEGTVLSSADCSTDTPPGAER